MVCRHLDVGFALCLLSVILDKLTHVVVLRGGSGCSVRAHQSSARVRCLLLAFFLRLLLDCILSSGDGLEPFGDLRLAVVNDLRVGLVDFGEVAGGISWFISTRTGRHSVLGVLASGVVALLIGSIRLNTDSDVR